MSLVRPLEAAVNGCNAVLLVNDENGGATSNGQNEPDPDTIKMFVGQVPRNWDEQQCRDMFEAFGPVYQLNVLRDKATQNSKGCCFVTFYHRKDAIAAQSALHNVKVLPGMHHPVQMKPADSENRNERKLFVGMLNKKLSESDVRQLFVNYGPIEDCTVLRDSEGKSKGCAFVTFASRTCAQNAIKQMHHSTTMEGCSMPLVVKFADTQKEKEAKKTQQQQQIGSLIGQQPMQSPLLQQLGAMNPNYMAMQQGGLGGGLNVLSQLPQLAALSALLQGAANNNPGALAAVLGNVLASLSSPSPPEGSPGAGQGLNLSALTTLATALAAVSNAQSSNGSGVAQPQQRNFSALDISQLMAGGAGVSPPLTTVPLNACYPAYASPVTSPPISDFFDQGEALFYGHNFSGQTTSPFSGGALPNAQVLGKSAAGQATNGNAGNLIQLTGNQQPVTTPTSASRLDALQQAYSGIQQYAATFPNSGAAGLTSPSVVSSQSAGAGKQQEGPDGANLFIYHLPQEFGDADLAQMFSPFGTVLSAKVFIDKQTNLSKCFGFVSYDNALSAQTAIQGMNGFQINTKRLKVQLKRSKDDGKPYQHPHAHAQQHALSAMTQPSL